MEYWIKRLGYRLAESTPVVWSHLCCLCRQRCFGKDLCSACSESICSRTERCPCCGLAGFSKDECPDCAYTTFGFDESIVGFCYQDSGRYLLHRFKFERRRTTGRIISSLLLDAITQADYVEWPEVIIPVPSHPWSRFLRGFNTADDLAADLSKALGIPIAKPFRAGYHKRKQRELSKVDRFCQVSKKYTLKDTCNLNWRYVVLVDDVMTTGATLSALSDLLKAQNVQKVHCWVASRAPLVD